MDEPPRALIETYRLVRLADLPALIVGALAAISHHRWGAYLLVADLGVQIALHMAVGVLAYRAVMRRPWPNVQPLDDWDD